MLPEASIWPIDADSGTLTAIAAKVESDVVPRLRALAARTRAVLVGGLIETSPVPGKVFNTVRAFAATGEDLGAYRKIHLYDAFGSRESDRYLAGPIGPLVFDVHGFAVGVMTCYDLRFPELARELVARGSELLLVPAAWVQGPLKEDHWNLLLRARAVENTCYVAAAAQCGPGYVGRSAVVDPLGVVTAALAEDEGVALADVEPARLQDVRSRLPVLANRRLPRTELELGEPDPPGQ